LSILHTLYLVLILGSFAFGLEAVRMGLGGQLLVLYSRGRGRALGLASLVGLAIVGLSIFTSSLASNVAAGPEPLYLCLAVLSYTLIAGGIVSGLRAKLIKPSPPPPPPILGAEIERMLRRRGFAELAGEEEK